MYTASIHSWLDNYTHEYEHMHVVDFMLYIPVCVEDVEV